MCSLTDRLMFPDINGRHILFDEDEDEDFLVIERRAYRLLNRSDVSSWDDFEFRQRFRFTKQSFHHLLAIVTPALARNHYR